MLFCPVCRRAAYSHTSILALGGRAEFTNVSSETEGAGGKKYPLRDGLLARVAGKHDALSALVGQKAKRAEEGGGVLIVLGGGAFVKEERGQFGIQKIDKRQAQGQSS